MHARLSPPVAHLYVSHMYAIVNLILILTDTSKIRYVVWCPDAHTNQNHTVVWFTIWPMKQGQPKGKQNNRYTVRQKSPRSRTWSFHPPSSFHKWRNGEKRQPMTKSLLNGNGVAEVPGIICLNQIFNNVYLFHQISFPSPNQQLWYFACTATEGCVPFYTNWLSFCLDSFTAMQCSSPSCTLKLTLRVLVLDDIISSNLGVAHSHYI